MHQTSLITEAISIERPASTAQCFQEYDDKIISTKSTANKTTVFLDLNLPLLSQIWNSGYTKEFYLEQVHKPHFYKGDGSAPLFGNFLEPLTKTKWWIVPLLWLPCVIYGTQISALKLQSLGEVLGYWVFGFAFWTLIEYGMHRFLFHIDRLLPDHRIGITLHFLLHGIHHFLPMDKLRLVMPPALFVILAAPFWQLSHLVFFYNWYAAQATFCGGVFGYVGYDVVHYFLHHRSLPKSLVPLKKYHLRHHFTDHEQGFGITSAFWDVVFNTKPPGSNATAL